MRAMIMALAIVMLAAQGRSEPQYLTSITEYLPKDCPTDGSIDLTEHVKLAFSECSALYFPGSNDPENPRVYSLRAQIVTRPGTVLEFGPNSLVRRLPSKGSLFRLGPNSSISGCVIDGNKYAHWPEFKDVGDEGPGVAGTKMYFGIRTASDCVVTDCFVYNSPGGGFCTRESSSKFIRCRSENVGFIDVKFGVEHYSPDRDKWSGDGFAIAGPQNIVRDCVSFDSFRWDFNSSHASVRGTTYIDCRGGDINWRSYGFVDFEESGANNRLIRCYSPNSSIAISSRYTQIIDCVASGISCHDSDFLTIRGCIITSDGVAVGWTRRDGEIRRGSKSPLITGNRIFMGRPTGTVAAEPLHVVSEDGKGIIEGNIIYAYEGEQGRTSKPISVERVEVGADENQVIYGEWKAGEMFVQPRMIRGSVDWDHIARRKAEYSKERASDALP